MIWWFISNPYGNDGNFSYIPGSFVKSNREIMNEIVRYAEKVKKDDDPEILLTHQPPKTAGKCAIDRIFNGRNVGNEYITKAMKQAGIHFSLSGHIHEAGGRGTNSKGSCVGQDVYSSELYFNPGSAAPWVYLNGAKVKGMAAIIEIKEGEMKYKVVNIEANF